MEMEANKVVLITGAGKGIGREFTLSLARIGYSIVCCSRTKYDLDSFSDEIDSFGGTATFIQADVRDLNLLMEVKDQVRAQFRKVDVLIVNAGIDLENSTVEDSDANKWRDVIEVNLIGSYNTVKAFLPLMKQNNGSQIILIGSGLGHRGLPKKSAYSISKAGQWMLVRVLAEELIEYGILVNEIVPGPVRTSIDREIQKERMSVSSVFTTEWNKETRDVVPILEFLLSQGKNGPTGQSFSLARRDLG